MSFNYKELMQFRDDLLALESEADQIMEELVIGEGVYAVRQAKSIAKNDNPDIVNTGLYRNSFHTGDRTVSTTSNQAHDGSKPRRNGKSYQIDVYNNADYAKHIEYGFRSHWVPGKWEGNTFVYIKGYEPAEDDEDDPGGMYVGPKDGYVKGRYVVKRAIRRVKITQEARLKRKFEQKIKERMGKWF